MAEDTDQTTTPTQAIKPAAPPPQTEVREGVERPMVNMPVSTLTREKRAAEERGARRAQKELLNMLGYENAQQMAEELRALRDFRSEQVRAAKERDEASARAQKEREEQERKAREDEEAKAAALLLARRRKAKKEAGEEPEDTDEPRTAAEEKKYQKLLEEERKAREEERKALEEEKRARAEAEERAADIEAATERDEAMRQIWQIAKEAGIKEDEEELVLDLVEKFVAKLDEAEMEEYTSPEKWVEGFFEPLKKRRPYLFGEAKPATTGATKPGDSPSAPNAADTAAAMNADKRDALKMSDMDARRLEQEILASAKNRNVREFRDRAS